VNITFTNTLDLDASIIEAPKPAKEFIPDWYKQIQSYISGKKEPNKNDLFDSNTTVKKCMPVFDMITAGYIITTPCDIYVDQKDGVPFFVWSGFNAIEFHPVVQTQGHPATKDGLPSPKFMCPWSIKTPKGWSTLIIQPTHRESVFTILPAIVDTDTYINTINFPFKLNDPSFVGLIPAGTPMVQVIPIKRDAWKMVIGGEKELTEISKIRNKFSTVFWDRYKRFWWNKKEYK
jgi:hypothetical protein